ncbi:hypothetical protein MTR_7g088300 [Medicago truncatula]|uniref:Uncharacterized protein n=1 Tax=Medicago truncatula TaxID=3880 RepID=G7L3T6_MEDTR|nr:hypothetical protein MTR_7g088300 [Medicago truncatula]
MAFFWRISRRRSLCTFHFLPLKTRKQSLRKLKLSVDSLTQTELWIWNLAFMPKWLRSEETIHSQIRNS